MASHWREVSAPIVAEVVRRVGLADRKALREALREAYPFGERERWPYKAWLMEVKAQTGGMRNPRRPMSQLDFINGPYPAKQMRVAVLFCRADSIYKKYSVADVYDAERDARKYQGPWPVVAHPPCRAWGALRFFSKPKKGERALAIFALRQVRKYGGVLEHPAASRLWPRCGLPKPGRGFDRYGGWTLGINQWDFGHRAKKPTFLYIVGCDPDSIPDLPLRMGTAEYVIGDVGRAANGTKRPEVSKAEREHTPRSLAEWLMELAIICGRRPWPSRHS